MSNDGELKVRSDHRAFIYTYTPRVDDHQSVFPKIHDLGHHQWSCIRQVLNINNIYGDLTWYINDRQTDNKFCYLVVISLYDYLIIIVGLSQQRYYAKYTHTHTHIVALPYTFTPKYTYTHTFTTIILSKHICHHYLGRPSSSSWLVRRLSMIVYAMLLFMIIIDKMQIWKPTEFHFCFVFFRVVFAVLTQYQTNKTTPISIIIL